MNKILERQLKKVFGSTENAPPNILPLLKLISDTYDHADEDRKLTERSLDISSRELMEKSSVLIAIFNSLIEGIIVVDTLGNIVNYNKRFVDLWKIPESVLKTKTDRQALSVAISLLQDPDDFMRKYNKLQQFPDSIGDDIIHFKDGRTLTYFTQPHSVSNRGVVGRIWSFKDITASIKSERDEKKRIKELENLNKFMINRELKVIELKKEIATLKSKLGHNGLE